MYIQAVTDGLLHRRCAPHTVARIDQPRHSHRAGETRPVGGHAGTVGQRPAGEAIRCEVPSAPRRAARQEV